jgi:redox-sensing transcriptional repressor
VRSVLNFAPAVITVPVGVELRKVDLSTELQILAFHEQRRATAAADGAGRLHQVRA